MPVICSVIFAGVLAMSGHITNAEKLTDVEKVKLGEAKAAVRLAQKNLDAVESKIAEAHKMTAVSYIEWQSWWEIDGDYIVQRYTSTTREPWDRMLNAPTVKP